MFTLILLLRKFFWKQKLKCRGNYFRKTRDFFGFLFWFQLDHILLEYFGFGVKNSLNIKDGSDIDHYLCTQFTTMATGVFTFDHGANFCWTDGVVDL